MVAGLSPFRPSRVGPVYPTCPTVLRTYVRLGYRREDLGTARPGLLSADRRAAGVVRGAARRRLGHRPTGGGRRRALHPCRRQLGLEPDAARPPAPRTGPGRLRQLSTAPGPGPPFAPGRRRAPASRPRAQLGALGRCIRGGGAQRRSPDGRAGRLCHCLEGDASAGPIRIGQSGCRRCSFRWDRLPLPAEADQRAGGPVDVPDPLQQPAPAAQRPAVARGPIACSTCARRSAWQRLNARCPR
jgi:hypothetical protein